MEVLYLDQLFAVNFLVDYCIVLAAARMADVPLRRGRYLLAALLGAVYAALTVLPGLAWLSGMPVKLACGIAMALIAFGGETRFWRCTAVFFGTAALFGGAVLATCAAAGTDGPGRALQHATLRILIPTFAVCYAVVVTVFRRRLRSMERTITDACIAVGGKTVRLRAMRDSGNTLRDPVSGARIAVASATALQPLIGTIPSDPADALSNLSGVVPGARLVPYAAVGVSAGLLPAFRPEVFTVGSTPVPLLVAVSLTPVCSDGTYQVLLPPES